MALTGQREWLALPSSYPLAERDADEWAGDNNDRAAVVEDFTRGVFIVMAYDAAESYVKDHDAEIQYDADHRPRTD